MSSFKQQVTGFASILQGIIYLNYDYLGMWFTFQVIVKDLLHRTILILTPIVPAHPTKTWLASIQGEQLP